MAECKFAVGDKVKCIEVPFGSDLVRDSVYTVTDVGTSIDSPVVLLEGNRYYWYASRFEKIIDEAPVTAQPLFRFEIGDRVVLDEGGWGMHTDLEGQVFTIDERRFYNGYIEYRVKGWKEWGNNVCFDGWTRECSFKKLEVVEEIVEEDTTEAEVTPNVSLSYGVAGSTTVTITLDPNVASSRKFANAFLDVVYGKEVS